jgi:hypothetical protein
MTIILFVTEFLICGFSRDRRHCLRNFVWKEYAESTMEISIYIATRGCGVFRAEWLLETSVVCMNFQTVIISHTEIIVPYTSIEQNRTSTDSRFYYYFRKLNSTRKFLSLVASCPEICNWFKV